jgi:hypothetical protein
MREQAQAQAQAKVDARIAAPYRKKLADAALRQIEKLGAYCRAPWLATVVAAATRNYRPQ